MLFEPLQVVDRSLHLKLSHHRAGEALQRFRLFGTERARFAIDYAKRAERNAFLNEQWRSGK